MYYEEKVINGVLCWRGLPTDTWQECSSRELTKRLLELQSNVAAAAEKLEFVRDNMQLSAVPKGTLEAIAILRAA
jgi:hypothetical protein